MLPTNRSRRWTFLWFCLFATSIAWFTAPVAAAPRCFPETKLCIDGRFGEYWEQQGGLPVFGLPISAETTAGALRTQTFERNRFELHAELSAPYDVLLGRLGDDRLLQQGRDWRLFGKAGANAPRYFAQTGHAISYEPFWRYWSSNGLDLGDPGISERESLALFGYPLSEPMIETNASGDTVLTQWFERARFEDHGAKGVLLGLLGSELSSNAGKEIAPVEDVVRLAWFYKPPTDGTSAATLARRVDDFILTHPDEEFRDQLIDKGVPRERILQYIMANEIQDPGSCTAEPWGNQFAFKAGDFCKISREYPDWFLLDRNGQRICKNNISTPFCLMDPGHPGWRQFAVDRARELQERWGWNGVFLDNVDGSRRRADNNSRIYADDTSYQDAVEGYLAYLQEKYFRPEGRPLFANITEVRDDAVWYRYMRLLDGAMDEGCIVGWEANYRAADEWNKQLDRLEKTQALGKTVFCVAQGEANDAAHQRFAFASYLLVADGNATFRYTSAQNYREFRHYNNYELDLGAPLGGRYRDGNGWRRDFARGSVFVDPNAQTSSITTR